MFTSEIPSIQSYDIEMRKSIRDKMFFIDHFDADVYVDYGCADGALFEFLSKVYPDKEFIGFDISEEQLYIARANFLGNRNVVFFSEWNSVKSVFYNTKKKGKKVALILNSIIHEVYSYADDDSKIVEFWDRVTNTGFDYISIRDMAVHILPSRNTVPLEDVTAIVDNYDSDRRIEFVQKWGSMTEKKNFIHFLLKYRYVENWDREVNENYLPIDLYQIDRILMENGKYREKHFDTFQVPFIMNKIREDFDISFPENTHFKMVLELDET